MRRGEVGTVTEARHAPERGARGALFLSRWQWRRVHHVQGMAAEQVIQYANSEPRFFVLGDEYSPERGNFQGIANDSSIGNRCDLAQPTSDADNLPPMEVKSPLMFHLGGKEEGAISEHPVNA